MSTGPLFYCIFSLELIHKWYMSEWRSILLCRYEYMKLIILRERSREKWRFWAKKYWEPKWTSAKRHHQIMLKTLLYQTHWALFIHVFGLNIGAYLDIFDALTLNLYEYFTSLASPIKRKFRNFNLVKRRYKYFDQTLNHHNFSFTLSFD